MTRFLWRSLLFFIAPVVWTIYLFLVDPYDYFNHGMDIVSQEAKKTTSYKLNVFIRTMVTYNNNPSPFLLVGDSRTKDLPISQIEKHTEDRYSS